MWSHFWGRSFPVAAWKQVLNPLVLPVLPIWYFSVTHSSKGKCRWRDSKRVSTVGTWPQFAVLHPCRRWHRVWHEELKGRSHHSWSWHWTAAPVQTVVYQDGVGSGKQKLLDALRTQITVPGVGGHGPLLLTAPHARAGGQLTGHEERSPQVGLFKWFLVISTRNLAFFFPPAPSRAPYASAGPAGI